MCLVLLSKRCVWLVSFCFLFIDLRTREGKGSECCKRGVAWKS